MLELKTWSRRPGRMDFHSISWPSQSSRKTCWPELRIYSTTFAAFSFVHVGNRSSRRVPLNIRRRELLTIAQDELAKVRRITTLPLGLYRSDDERPQQVRVSKLIDNVLSLYGRKLRTLGASTETRYDGNIPVTAPGELQPVFSNFILMPPMRLRIRETSSASISLCP